MTSLTAANTSKVSSRCCSCFRSQAPTSRLGHRLLISAVAKAEAEQQQRSVSKRKLLAGLAVAPFILHRLNSAQAAEGDVTFLEPGASVVGRFVETADGWRTFETLEFQFEVPTGFQYIDQVVEPPKNAGRGRAPPPSPIKAKFADANNMTVSVMEYSGSQIKPTFFQLSDITQFGNLPEVGRLLIPAGSRVLSSSKAIIQPPERDTGTLRGKVKPPSQTIYRYEYQTTTGLHVAVAAAAKAGRVLLAGGTAPIREWDARPDLLPRVAKSFRLANPA